MVSLNIYSYNIARNRSSVFISHWRIVLSYSKLQTKRRFHASVSLLVVGLSLVSKVQSLQISHCKLDFSSLAWCEPKSHLSYLPLTCSYNPTSRLWALVFEVSHGSECLFDF